MPPLHDLTWRFLLSMPMTGVDNMALDEALLARARTSGEAVLRLYTWSRPTLSLGRNQTARGVYEPRVARERGIDIVRRLTGGRALLHHREVTYSVSAPDTGESLKQTYGTINGLLLDALRRLGVDATLAPAGDRLSPPASAPCFERPAPGEVVLSDRKLVGSAQVRGEGGVLQHGSLLVEDDQRLVVELASAPVGDVVPAATLAAALGRTPTLVEVAAAFYDALEQRVGRVTPLESSEIEAGLDFQSARARYGNDKWTWRR